jgi:hypothetical protein
VREVIEFETEKGGLQPNLSLTNVEESALVMGMNAVYNDVETQEMHFAVNGRDESSSMKITGYRCKDFCKLDPVPDPDVRTELRWSDKDTWPHLGRVPIAGDEVEIREGWEVLYDAETSPILKSLEVNGKLTFERGKPAILQSHSIWIRAGEVNVGTEDEPFDSTVEFRLHGNNESPSEFVFAP